MPPLRSASSFLATQGPIKTVFALGLLRLISRLCAFIGVTTSARYGSRWGKYFWIRRLIEWQQDEISMSGFGETPLMPGSISVWGSNPLQHWEFANEICSERLIRKYVHPSGKLAWDFSPPMGPNHFGDAGTGMFALASWFRLYDALPKVLDAAAAGKLPPADLFDPIQNPAVAENASAAPGVRPRCLPP